MASDQRRFLRFLLPATAAFVLATAVPCAVPAYGQSAGWAAPAAPSSAKPYDLNVYPALGNSGGTYDLSVAATQNSPPGTIAMTNTAPPAAYSFKDVLANTHGFVEAGVASRGGHEFSGGVSIPIVPGKAELDLAAGTGQIAGVSLVPGQKTPIATYDTYSAGLHLHPADDLDAYIGIAGLRLHGPAPAWYGYP
jgi:hypothetical protein